MSIAGGNGTFEEPKTVSEISWGDFSGYTGEELGDGYGEVFEDVKNVLSDAGEYLTFENIELPKDQILEKYKDELEPGEDEYLEAELKSYPTEDGKFNILELEKGEIEDIKVANTASGFKPTVKTDEFPTGENERVVSVNKSGSERYRIMWEN